MGCLLWEIDAPEDNIIKYCNTAWECLRKGKAIIFQRFIDSCKNLQIFDPNKKNKIVKDFKYWKYKNEQQLLNAMFLEKFVNGCSDAIVFHPVEQYSISIKKNPKIEDKWWANLPKKNTGKTSKQIIPCAQCPGRAEN